MDNQQVPDPKQILLKVLEIIEYQEDKDKFATDFLELCMKKALVDLIEALPQEQQQKIQGELTPDKTPEQVQQTLQSYFTPNQYLQQLQVATQFLFQDYIKTIMPVLNPTQREHLQQYLASIVPPEMIEQYKQQLQQQQNSPQK